MKAFLLLSIVLSIFQYTKQAELKPISDICLSIKEFEEKYPEELAGSSFPTYVDSLDKIGAGSFGSVYKTQFQNKDIIVKKIEIDSDYAIKSKLAIREINALSLVKENSNYQNMIECVYSGEPAQEITQPTTLYFLGDRYHGELYKEKELFMEKLSTKERIEKYIKLAEGLLFLHSKNFVHSDLKPENVMTKDEAMTELKIIDLGMATPTGNTVVGGTPYYMPVVQVTQDLLISEKFDVFSLAMTIIQVEIGFEYSPVFSAYQLIDKQKEFIKKFQDQHKLKVKGEDNIGFFTRLWHSIKRLFGFTVIDNMNQLITCMTAKTNKSRCSMQTVKDTLSGWEFVNVSNEEKQKKEEVKEIQLEEQNVNEKLKNKVETQLQVIDNIGDEHLMI